MTNWPVKTLGELFDFQNGRGFKKTEWSKSGLPIIRIQNLNSDSAGYNHFSGTFDPRIQVEAGDLLFSWSGSIGTSFGPHVWQRSTGLLNQHIFKVYPKVPIETSYAHYCLRAITAEIERSVNGAVGLVHITKEKLNKFEIPVPPLAEQKRIVALLDAATARVTELTACYEQARTHANDLFTSALCDALESNPDWPVKNLGAICEVFDDGDWIESKDQASSGVRLIQTGNVGDGEFKDRSDKARFISEPTFSRLRCTEIFPGDLLVSRLPDPVGRACLIPDTGSKMITAVDCTIMRPRKEIMLPQFLVLSTQTSGYREQVRAKITGTTRDRISRSNLAEVQVSVPPIEEQKRIIARLDSMKTKTTEMVAAYDAKLRSAKDLRQSILESAFAGDL
jgi:restriction endonuclease S subunit